ncbi:MAG: D-alanine--D-alanine ligase family protein [Oscillospiraceae bacterium]
MAKIKVAVIFGGISSEHDVSLRSATNVIENIPKDKYEVICVGITEKGRWLYFPDDISRIKTGEWEKSPDCTPAVLSPDTLHSGLIKLEGDEFSTQKIDVIFPVLHGNCGEDGTIQALIEMSGIPYVGSNHTAAACCMDKDIAATMFSAAGIPVAEWYTFTQSDLAQLDERCADLAAQIGFPMIVKPAVGGSSIGINKVNDETELSDAIKFAFAHGKKVVVQDFIKGRELECGIFGNETPVASQVGEITFSNDIYGYEEKNIFGSAEKIVPADIDDNLAEEIRKMAVGAFKTMGCSGLGKAKFFLKKDGGIILSGIDPMPKFTPLGMYEKMMTAFGIPMPKLLDKLICLAFDKADISMD